MLRIIFHDRLTGTSREGDGLLNRRVLRPRNSRSGRHVFLISTSFFFLCSALWHGNLRDVDAVISWTPSLRITCQRGDGGGGGLEKKNKERAEKEMMNQENEESDAISVNEVKRLSKRQKNEYKYELETTTN